MDRANEYSGMEAEFAAPVQLLDGALPPLFALHPMPMWLYEMDGARILDVNQAALRTYGYSREEFLTKTLFDLRPEEDAARFAEELDRLRQGQPEHGFHKTGGWRHLRRDGSMLWVEVHGQDIIDAGRRLRLVMVHDVSEMQALVDQAHQQGAYFRQLFLGSPDAIAMLDRHDTVLDVNPAFEKLFQFPFEEVVRRNINELVVPPGREAEGAALSAMAYSGATERLDTVRSRKDGSPVHVSAFSYPLLVKGEVVGAYAIYQDRTRTRRLVSELSYQATHDRLTGLLNRAEFERAAAERLGTASNGHRGFALLHIDLDQFKLISDSYGAAVGDNLLRETAALLKLKTRASDLVARIGTTEFTILLCDLTLSIAEQFTHKLVQAAEAHRFSCEGRPWPVQISVGLMHRAKDGPETIGDLVGGAAMACHVATENGRSHVEVFRHDDPELRRHRNDVAWSARIAESIAQDRLILYLQRIAPTAAPDQGSRYEVLLRLIDENGAVMPPGALIAAAERFRMMPLIDRYVIDMALAHLSRARDLGTELPESISINISGMSLGQHNLATYIYDKILQYGIMPGLLCFEITETAAIRNLDVAGEFVTDMRNLGCSVALDDFGTGMSSFAYLKNFDVDYIKIDGQFVRDMLTNPFDSATVEAMNKLAQIKGSRTVAEFVENQATLDRLREMGVDYVQGFHLHRPEPWAVGTLPRPNGRVLEQRAA